MANVEVILSAQDASVVRAWQNYKNNIAAVDAQMGKLANTNQKAGESSRLLSQMLTVMPGQVIGIGSAIDVPLKAVEMLRKEWEKVLERQDRALAASGRYAVSLETLAFNTAGDAKFNTLEKVERRVLEISNRTGVGINDVSRAVSNAASAKGQLPLEDAFSAVEDVLAFAPNSPQLQDVLSGAALDVRKMYPNATAQDAIGFTAMLGQQARITDPAKVAENALPGALLMSKVDKGSLRDNAAIYAAITQATGDVQGRTSRTGGIALAIQLEKALPELNSTMERVQYLQDNPDLANQFLNGGGKRFKGKGLTMDVIGPDGQEISFGTDKASFEKKVVPAIRELLTKGSATDVNMRSALEAIPEIEQGRKVYEKQLEALRQSKSLAVANRNRTLQTTAENELIQNPQEAQKAVTREQAQANLSAAGVSWTEIQKIMYGARGREFAGTDYNTAVEQAIQATIDRNLKLIDKYPDSQAPALEEENRKLRKVMKDLGLGKLLNANEPAAIPQDNGGLPGPDATPEEIERFKKWRPEAFQKWDAARQQSEPAPAPVVQVAAPNVQVLMPGGAAPARPVAASKIGGRRT